MTVTVSQRINTEVQPQTHKVSACSQEKNFSTFQDNMNLSLFCFFCFFAQPKHDHSLLTGTGIAQWSWGGDVFDGFGLKVECNK